MRSPEPPKDMPPEPPKMMSLMTPLVAFFNEVSSQLAPDYQALAELVVNLRLKPNRSDVARALFRAKKLSAVLEEAQRQMMTRGWLPSGDPDGARGTQSGPNRGKAV